MDFMRALNDLWQWNILDISWSQRLWAQLLRSLLHWHSNIPITEPSIGNHSTRGVGCNEWLYRVLGLVGLALDYALIAVQIGGNALGRYKHFTELVDPPGEQLKEPSIDSRNKRGRADRCVWTFGALSLTIG